MIFNWVSKVRLNEWRRLVVGFVLPGVRLVECLNVLAPSSPEEVFVISWVDTSAALPPHQYCRHT